MLTTLSSFGLTSDKVMLEKIIYDENQNDHISFFFFMLLHDALITVVPYSSVQEIYTFFPTGDHLEYSNQRSVQFLQFISIPINTDLLVSAKPIKSRAYLITILPY